MVPMFHFFCKKPDRNDPELAKIKAVRITSVAETYPASYEFVIDYKDGTTSETQYGRAASLHDKYSKFLPLSTVLQLHNEMRWQPCHPRNSK